MITSDDAATGTIERWLFAPVDTRVVAVFRVAVACTVAWWLVSFYALVTPVAGVGGVCAVAGALAAFAAGWRPRISGALLAALLVPLWVRESLHVMFVAVVAITLMSGGPHADRATPIWPLRLVQLQLSAVYLVNAFAKTTTAYLSGDVLAGFAQTLPNFVGRVDGGALHFGPFALPLAIAAVASAASEWVLGIGFWVPSLRRAIAAFGVAFHLILKLVIRIGMLDWTCMTLYLAFLLPFEDATLPSRSCSVEGAVALDRRLPPAGC